MSIKDDAGTVVIVGLGIFVLYQALKGGLFGKGVSDVLTGKVGERAGEKVFNTSLTPDYDIKDYTTYDSSYGTGNKTLGAVLFSGKSPLEKLKELLFSGYGGVGVETTDKAFAKIGINTAQAEWITNNYGAEVMAEMIRKINQNEQLADDELSILTSIGWHNPNPNIPTNYTLDQPTVTNKNGVLSISSSTLGLTAAEQEGLYQLGYRF